jgi:hypothetical protein
MLLGLALTVAALIALHILDGADGIRNRRVLPSQLILFDAEWARRKQAGLLPPPKMTDTASLSP